MTVHTGNTVFAGAMALLGESSETSHRFKEVSVFLINLLIVELFSLNNTMRKSREKEPIADVFQINDISDEIPFEPEITIGIMPYGIAFKLIADEDSDKSAFLAELYRSTLFTLRKSKISEIKNLY